ncbi:MAG: tyrosine-type recombinase/integrase, partial [Kiritimatiellae bacterium]|nr:tyrosine-type recombinase/integrase [Kiritimatiellia bacterium]
GLRLGDCCLLAWDAVDFAAGVLRVVPRKTRRYLAGRPVVIPLHAELAAELAAVPPAEREGCVLPAIASDYGLRRWALSRAIAAIFAEAGIETSVAVEGRSRRAPSATFHSLRHTFVSVAVNAGIPLATVQAIVGHKSTAMTGHYYHPSVEALRRAVDAMPPIMQRADRNGAAPAAGAAGAAAASGVTVGRASSRRPRSLSSRLQDIARALAKGLITPQEFASLRAAILADA